MVQMQPFYLVSSSNTQLAIQAGNGDGQAVTLQTLDTTNPLQVWVLQAQIVNGYQGAAFVNPFTGNSVTYNGEFQALVMQPYSAGSGDFDVWNLLPGDSQGSLRIAYAVNNQFSWNDKGGAVQPGDTIALWNDTFVNSVWQVVLAPLPALQSVQVHALAGEPAAV